MDFTQVRGEVKKETNSVDFPRTTAILGSSLFKSKKKEKKRAITKTK
tara:strand:+ start:333 stop:473 length:141 start_codon:yes stop_codon:yes gene_type:complete